MGSQPLRGNVLHFCLSVEMEEEMNKHFNVRALVTSSVLIALALVAAQFSVLVYFGGAGGMRVGIVGIFTRTIAYLFGPVVAGVANTVNDLLGFMIRPMGPFIPLMTVTTALGGVLNGLLWKHSSVVNKPITKIIALAIMVGTGVLGLVNTFLVYLRPELSYSQTIASLTTFPKFLTTFGLIIPALIGLVMVLYNRKKASQDDEKDDLLLRLIIVGSISGLIVTVLNTFVLRAFIPGLDQIGFWIYLIPRIVESLISVVLHSYVIAIILNIYHKRFA